MVVRIYILTKQSYNSSMTCSESYFSQWKNFKRYFNSYHAFQIYAKLTEFQSNNVNFDM